MVASSWGTSSEYPVDSAESRAYLGEHVVLPFLQVTVEACSLKTKDVQHECSISCLTVPFMVLSVASGLTACSIFKVRTKPCHCKHKNQLCRELHISPCLKLRASVFTEN